jgi:hypothetical protein
MRNYHGSWIDFRKLMGNHGSLWIFQNNLQEVLPAVFGSKAIGFPNPSRSADVNLHALAHPLQQPKANGFSRFWTRFLVIFTGV